MAKLGECIESSAWQDIIDLFLKLKQVGRQMIKAVPTKFVVGNIVKRVLHVIRDVAKSDRIVLPPGEVYEVIPMPEEYSQVESLLDLVRTPRPSAETVVEERADRSPETRLASVKDRLESSRNMHKYHIQHEIEDIVIELENTRGVLLRQAPEYIVPDDVILTYNLSYTLVEFFAVLHFTSSRKPPNIATSKSSSPKQPPPSSTPPSPHPQRSNHGQGVGAETDSNDADLGRGGLCVDAEDKQSGSM
jgi:translation initiation factor 2B subunit (eIF-2B alpha/beta/delta family)